MVSFIQRICSQVGSADSMTKLNIYSMKESKIDPLIKNKSLRKVIPGTLQSLRANPFKIGNSLNLKESVKSIMIH